MPRQIDHDQRRTVIAEAAGRLIVAGGLEAVSMRQVAAAAGISLGQVQHYFATKDELLRYALGAASGRTYARYLERADQAPRCEEGVEPRQLVHTMLVERLPLDDGARVDAHIGFAFLARAMSEPELAKALRKRHESDEYELAELLRRGQREGTVRLDLDAMRAARTLLAVVDGLTAHVLVGHHTAWEADQAFEHHLDDLFGA